MTSASRIPRSTEPISVEDPAALDEIIAAHPSVLVEFYADWCDPCQALDPVLRSLAREFRTVVATVDIETNPRLAFAHRARSVPLLKLYRHGEPVERIVGGRSPDELRDLLSRYEP